MIRNAIIAALAVAFASTTAVAQTEIQWWHSMTGANNTGVNELAARFNASQKEYKIVPVFKGSYPESMTAAIAAFRAGNPPHIRRGYRINSRRQAAVIIERKVIDKQLPHALRRLPGSFK